MTARVLAIDPGGDKVGCACAFFSEGGLFRVGFEARPAYPADVVVVERPEVQGDRTRRARPQDLMGLAWNGAMAAGYVAGASHGRVVELTPSQWKGREPKPLHHARLWEILAPHERHALGGAATERAIVGAIERGAGCRWSRPGADLYPRSFTTHNLLDAAALGAFWLGRLARADAGRWTFADGREVRRG